MKFVDARPYAQPEAAARKLAEIAAGIKPIQEADLHRAGQLALPDRVQGQPARVWGGLALRHRAGLKEAFVPLSETQFSTENVLERKDLQRLLRTHIGLIDPDLMVISEEFSQWVDSSRSIDLLCLDKDANLVVVELKRTQDGGHMELQAIRYAAMISRITFPQMVEAHKYYLARLRLRPTRRVVLWLRSPVHDELW
jgi:Endonuclease NucS